MTPMTATQLSTKQLSAIYDRIYNIADRLFKKYNPCSVHIKNKRICCKNYKRGILLTNKYNLCCSRCSHCSIDGCTIKCLPCKLFICHQFEYSYDKNDRSMRNKKYKSFVDRLYRLKKVAKRYNIVISAFYHTKKEVLILSERLKKGNTADDHKKKKRQQAEIR